MKEIILAIKKTINNFVTLSFYQGQFRSMVSGVPEDKNGEPIPWYTYPALEYLNNVDFSDSEVFEYGSGNSTRYWSKRAKKIASLENDQEWYEKNNKRKSKNTTLLLEENYKKYPGAIHKIAARFDVIIIDGIERYQSAQESVTKLKDDGIIILDNSDWHQETSKYLNQSGFSQIDFFGFGPINDYKWCTSIFFKGNFSFKKVDLEKQSLVPGTRLQQEVL